MMSSVINSRLTIVTTSSNTRADGWRDLRKELFFGAATVTQTGKGCAAARHNSSRIDPYGCAGPRSMTAPGPRTTTRSRSLLVAAAGCARRPSQRMPVADTSSNETTFTR
jgi:hypothetical protein